MKNDDDWDIDKLRLPGDLVPARARRRSMTVCSARNRAGASTAAGVRYKTEMDAQRVKRKRHIDILRERNVQAENFADIDRQKRESEREQMRQVTQRKLDAWQKEKREEKGQKEKEGGEKDSAAVTDSFAKAILKAAKQEAQRPKDRDLGRDYGR